MAVLTGETGETGETLEAGTARSLVYGLRIATAAIAAAIMGTSSLWRKLGDHHPLWTQTTAYGVLTLILLAEGVLIARRRQFGDRTRWIAVCAALSASALSAWTLPNDFVATSSDWAFGTVGWFGVILLLDRRLAFLVVFLALQELTTVARVVVVGPTGSDFLLNFAAGSITVVGYPLGTAIGVAAIQGAARAAAKARRQTELIRTSESISARLHDHRQQRFAATFRTTEPLLQGLAGGSLDPADPEVQRLCAVEAARMRRLFAESDSVADPLLHELRHCADVADRRGVVVEFEVSGTWAPVPLDIRRALTDTPLAVLSTAGSWARVSVVGTPGVLSVNVVADAATWEVAPADHDEIGLRTFQDGGTLWVEAQWTPGRFAR